MRKPDSKKLLLLPLIPVLALGIVEVASAIIAPTTVSIESPEDGRQPIADRCFDCAMPA